MNTSYCTAQRLDIRERRNRRQYEEGGWGLYEDYQSLTMVHSECSSHILVHSSPQPGLCYRSLFVRFTWTDHYVLILILIVIYCTFKSTMDKRKHTFPPVNKTLKRFFSSSQITANSMVSCIVSLQWNWSHTSDLCSCLLLSLDKVCSVLLCFSRLSSISKTLSQQ